jgi:hypothetical protein
VLCSAEEGSRYSNIDTDEWLERVFTGVLADTYDAWAATYDSDMLAVGYMHPALAAGFVGRYVRALEGSILDAGAGTGIVGQILSTKLETDRHAPQVRAVPRLEEDPVSSRKRVIRSPRQHAPEVSPVS